MSLALDKRCLATLIKDLAECLDKVTVTHGKYLTTAELRPLFACDRTLPQSKGFRASIEKYIGETPFFDFITGELTRELSDRVDAEKKTEKCFLKELPDYEDVAAVATRLVDAFNSLPRRYCFSFALNSGISKYFTESAYSLGDGLRLVRATGDFQRAFPQERKKGDKPLFGIASLLSYEPFTWNSEHLYFQTELLGFHGKWTNNRPEEVAVNQLKSFVGAMIGLRTMEMPSTYSPFLQRKKFAVHEWRDDSWRLVDVVELNELMASGIDQLRPDNLDGHLVTEIDLTNNIEVSIPEVQKIFADHPANERVMLASKWLLDSYITRDELLAFIQATVALEILLGDKKTSEEIGLGALLKNRCAYLVGVTHSQREEVERDFDKIYAIRSKIVHRGKDRLRLDERTSMAHLRWLVGRVIQEETKRFDQSARE